jgi:hypothetical protein
MRPKERRDTGQTDLSRSRLDAIIDTGRPLVKLVRTIEWPFLEQKFGAVYEGPRPLRRQVKRRFEDRRAKRD